MYTTYISYSDRDFRKQAAKAGLSAYLEKKYIYISSFLEKQNFVFGLQLLWGEGFKSQYLYVLRLALFQLLWTALWELVAFQASYFCMCTSAFLLRVALLIHKHLLMVLQRLQITFFSKACMLKRGGCQSLIKTRTVTWTALSSCKDK